MCALDWIGCRLGLGQRPALAIQCDGVCELGDCLGEDLASFSIGHVTESDRLLDVRTFGDKVDLADAGHCPMANPMR